MKQYERCEQIEQRQRTRRQTKSATNKCPKRKTHNRIIQNNAILKPIKPGKVKITKSFSEGFLKVATLGVHTIGFLCSLE